MQTKPALRKHYNAIRAQLVPDYRQAADQIIFEKVIQLPQIKTAKTICCYVSHKEEVDTHSLINYFITQNQKVVITKVIGNDLGLFEISSLNECVAGFKGILEPHPDAKKVDPSTVDVFIILALAYDTKGYRLGYGKGYTDRLLGNLENGFRIGLCYVDQLAYSLPHEAHDIPVDLVISDELALTPSIPVHF